MKLSAGRTLVLADIPGIIEGAHEGKGLGLKFLRHIERTRVLACVIPVDSPNPQIEYELLRRELREYSPELARKPHCVIFSKADLLPEEADAPDLDAPAAEQVFLVSGVAQTGLESVQEGLWRLVQRSRDDEEESEQVPLP